MTAWSLLWVDLETTGLDENDPLLEIAGIITDEKLNPMSDFNAVAYFDRDSLPIDPFVLAMHDESGLWDECIRQNPRMGTRQVLDQFESWLIECGLGGGFVLCGSGVSHFDARWLDHHSPMIAAKRAYYTIDVGSVRRLFTPHIAGPELGEKAHRAVDDIDSHLEEAQWYVEAMRRLA